MNFEKLSEQEKLNFLVSLVKNDHGHKGAYYASLLRKMGYSDAVKSEINRILYKYKEIFVPNQNEFGEPAWTLKTQTNATKLIKNVPDANKNDLNQIINEFKEIKESNLDKQVKPARTTYPQTKIDEPAKNKDISTSPVIKKMLDEQSYWNNYRLHSWQEKVLKAWQANNRIGFCVSSRKTGKSFLAKRIALYHAYSKGPVVVVLNTLDEIGIWYDDLSELNKSFGWHIKILRNDIPNQYEIEDKSILLVTKYWLRKIPLIVENILLIFDNIETNEFKSENFSKISNRLLMGLTTPKSTKIVDYFKTKLIEYSFTEAMLEDIIQDFTLNFKRVSITEDEVARFNKYRKRIDGERVEGGQWIDVLAIKEFEKAKQSPSQLLIGDIDELYQFTQRLESKFSYFLSKIKSFNSFEKVIIFCENPKVIMKMFEPLIQENIDYLVYSAHEDLNYLSRSPHEWQSQKVLITDHIKYFSNFNFDYIDYALIFGTLGNSVRLTQKLEAIFNERRESKKLMIDVLCAESTVEDPFMYSNAYEVFKDYRTSIVFDKPKIVNITKPIKKNIEEAIDISKAKILIVYPHADRSFESKTTIIEKVYQLPNETIDVFEYQKTITIKDIIHYLKSGYYCDVFIEAMLTQEDILELHEVYEFDHSVVIKIFQNSSLTLGRLISFLVHSQKYLSLKKEGVLQS